MTSLSGSLFSSDRGRLAVVWKLGMFPSKGTVKEPCWGVHGYIARIWFPIWSNGVLRMQLASAFDWANTRSSKRCCEILSSGTKI